MTNNTEPTIDTLKANILTEFKQVLKLAPADYTENCTNVVMSLVDEYAADQVARARIEELEHIISGSEYSADDFDWYEITRAEYTGTKYYSEVRHLTKEERIAELEATLNGEKNK